MNLCDVYIEKIIEVRTYDNFVIAILDTDCWGCKRKGEKVFFQRRNGRKRKKTASILLRIVGFEVKHMTIRELTENLDVNTPPVYRPS